MTVSNTILTKTIPEAAPSGNTLTKILSLTDTSSDVAKIALGIESLGFFVKHILSDLATYDLAALNADLYGDNIQTFNEITPATAGVGLVPIGISGSPQPLQDGTLLSFGPDDRKVQILAFNNLTLWFRIARTDARATNAWKKINAGIVSHRFYAHSHNNLTSPTVQTHNINIPEYVQSVQITLWGAGGGGGTIYAPPGSATTTPRYNNRVTAAYVGENASESTVQYFSTNNPTLTLRAVGGLAGNDHPVPVGDIQGTSVIPDASPPRTNNWTTYSIAGGGMPGGISEKVVRIRPSSTQTIILPQDGLPGELSVASFDVAGGDRLVINLAPGGRNAGYDGDDFVLNGFGYIGKSAACEVIMF